MGRIGFPSGGDAMIALRGNLLRVAVCLVPALLSACGAGTRTEERPEIAVEPGSQACFYRRQASDWQILDRSNLIVYAPNKSNAYHVVISPPASELRFANALAFVSRQNRICGYAGDAIVLDSGPGSRRLSITAVYRLNEVALQRLLAAHGKGQPAEELGPEPTEGAEIEREIDSPEQQ